MKRDAQFKAGQKVDDFVLDQLLGGGQDGEVWRATKLSIGKRCALKFLNSVSDADKLARFENEIKILASIDHPNIVLIHDRGRAWNPSTSELVPYYAMEFVTGVPLLDALEAIPADDRVDAFCAILRQIFSALDSTHSTGISHGDIKSANVMVLPREQVAKLTDFGFGLLSGNARDRAEYPSSSYHAPRHLSPIEADLYRLGKTITDCVTRLPPESQVVGVLADIAAQLGSDPPAISLADAARTMREAQLGLTRVSGAVATSGTGNSLQEFLAGDVVIRDSILGDVPVSRGALALIDTAAFQRLRHVKVSAAAEMVYPALSLTVLELSLGEFFSALDALRQDMARPEPTFLDAFTPEELRVMLVATLLHRIGQPPFLDELARATDYEVDLHRASAEEIMREPLAAILNGQLGLDPREVAELLGDRFGDPARRKLQAFHDGLLAPMSLEFRRRILSRAGMLDPVDYRRLAAGIVYSPEAASVVIKESHTRFIEDVVRADLLVTDNILGHKTARAASLMVERALRLVQYDGLNWRDLLPLSDAEFISACRKAARRESGRTAIRLLDDFASRKIYRTIVAVPAVAAPRVGRSRDAEAIEREIAHHARVAPDEIIVDPPRYVEFTRMQILLANGEVKNASDVSPTLAALERQLQNRHRQFVVFASAAAAVQCPELATLAEQVLRNMSRDREARII